MFFFPTAPCGHLRGQEKKLHTLKRPSNRTPPGLRPDRFCFVVEPGHGTHKECACVTKSKRNAVDSPVVHETGVADRSPGDQDRDSGQFIVDHLAKSKDGDRVSFRLFSKRYPDDQLLIS